MKPFGCLLLLPAESEHRAAHEEEAARRLRHDDPVRRVCVGHRGHELETPDVQARSQPQNGSLSICLYVRLIQT